MFSRLNKLVNLGIDSGQSPLNQRRIRLINSFALISVALILLFGFFNLALEYYTQALIILSGLTCVSIPPLYLNYQKKYEAARHYFTIVSTLFITLAISKSIMLGQNRYNEVFMIGFSTLIIMVFEKRARTIYFLLWAVLTLAMITFREIITGTFPSSDTIMGYINAIAGFSCVYFFLSLYKRDLIKSNKKLELTTQELKNKRRQVTRQRDEIDASKNLLRATINSLPVFIAMLDMEGKYLIANSRYEEVFGMPIEEIEGRNFKEVLPDAIRETHDDFVERGLKGEELEFEELSELPNGENIEVIGKYLPVYNEKKEQVALAVYVVDVTRLKQTEAKLIALNNTKNRLLSLISHDLKSPLNSLKGLINLAGDLKEDQMKNFINKVGKKLTLVSFSLDNLLNWAKAQMDGFKIKPEPMRVSELTKQCIALFEDQIKKKNISLSTSFMDDEPDGWVDQESTNLVIRNILSNAIKFTPESGKINVTITEDDKFIILSIIDTGKGIEETCVSDLTKGAQYIKSTSGTSGEQGTGLGLSLSMEIMRKNGGKLVLKNNKSKSGTTAGMFFPKAAVKETT